MAGAEVFVRGASRLAAAMGMSKVTIGLTVVSLGMSMPEISVALLSTARTANGADIVIGNVVGSNIANMLLIGICALIRPVSITPLLLRTALPLLILSQLFLYYVGRDGRVLPVEGVGLLCAGFAYIAFTVHHTRRRRVDGATTAQLKEVRTETVEIRAEAAAGGVDDYEDDERRDDDESHLMTLIELELVEDSIDVSGVEEEEEGEEGERGDSKPLPPPPPPPSSSSSSVFVTAPPPLIPAASGVCRGRLSVSTSRPTIIDLSSSFLLFVVGLITMLLGAVWVVDGAVHIARQHNLDELTIALAIIATGTSLPDLSSSVIATIRGSAHIAIGAALGGSIVNSLVVVGIAAATTRRGLFVSEAARDFDLPCQTILALLLIPIFMRSRKVTRGEGAFLVVCYVFYMYGVALRSLHHKLLFQSFKRYVETLFLPAAMLLSFLGVVWRLWRSVVSIEREVAASRVEHVTEQTERRERRRRAGDIVINI